MRSAPLIWILLIAVVVLWWLMPAGTGIALWDQAVAWVLERQRLFHRGMADQLRALGGGLPAASWGLVSLSFLYGIFHAAGPGHGKAVIATYLAAHETHLRRGLALAVGASLCQGLVAIVLVHGLLLAAYWLPLDSQKAADWSERASFVLLALLGALFAGRAVRGMIRAQRALSAIASRPHQHDDQCGCCHGPSVEQAAQADDWRGTVYVLLAIGLRPCSGAILVLALANVLGLEWAGIGAVAAMSTGTAITVAALALMVVKARHWAAALIKRRGGGLALAGQGVALLGGVLILLMALSLLAASFGPAHPLRV